RARWLGALFLAHAPPATGLSPLSLHDALPISDPGGVGGEGLAPGPLPCRRVAVDNPVGGEALLPGSHRDAVACRPGGGIEGQGITEAGHARLGAGNDLKIIAGLPARGYGIFLPAARQSDCRSGVTGAQFAAIFPALIYAVTMTQTL